MEQFCAAEAFFVRKALHVKVNSIAFCASCMHTHLLGHIIWHAKVTLEKLSLSVAIFCALAFSSPSNRWRQQKAQLLATCHLLNASDLLLYTPTLQLSSSGFYTVNVALIQMPLWNSIMNISTQKKQTVQISLAALGTFRILNLCN